MVVSMLGLVELVEAAEEAVEGSPVWATGEEGSLALTTTEMAEKMKTLSTARWRMLLLT